MIGCIGRPPKLALVGCSWFARAAHLPALRKLTDEGIVDVVALCSRTDDSLSKALEIMGMDIPTYKSFDQMLSLQSIDLVDLVLPTPMMEEAVIKCFDFGKNVISEKPCAPNVETSNRLIMAHANTNLSWSVAENWPFKPTVIALSKILKKGNLGELITIDFSFKAAGWGEDGHAWRTSPDFRGGYLLDSGVHFISMLRFLTGGVAEVNANVGWHKSKFVADRVQADMAYENGATGKFVVDFTRWPDQGENFNLVIKCSNGLIKVNLLKNIILIQSGGSQEIIQIADDPWVQGGVYSMLRHCCESLSKGLTTSCTPIEGMKDVAVIEAMLESDRINKAVCPGLLYHQIIGQAKIINTYSNLFDFKPKSFTNPTSSFEVSAAIREAVSLGLRVRPTGVGYNWTSYSNSKGLVINLNGLNKKCCINLNKKTIRVDSGFLMSDVTRALADHGLCLPSLPFLAEGTIGGMVSTGSHGTSPSWGTLSDSIISMTLVTPKGEIIEISEEVNSRLLRAARLSVGMLGVITEIEFQAVDMKWVRNIKIDIGLEDFLKAQSEIFKRYEHVWVHWLIGTKNFIVQCLESSNVQMEGFLPYASNGKASWIQAYYHAKPFEYHQNNIMLSMQYGVGLNKLALVIDLINQSNFAEIHSGREIELKFLKQNSSTLLGPNADEDAVLFNTFWPCERNLIKDIFSDFEIIMQSINARPHWGKYHSMPTSEYMVNSYSQWNQFDLIRKEMDPSGTFNIFEISQN